MIHTHWHKQPEKENNMPLLPSSAFWDYYFVWCKSITSHKIYKEFILTKSFDDIRFFIGFRKYLITFKIQVGKWKYAKQFVSFDDFVIKRIKIWIETFLKRYIATYYLRKASNEMINKKFPGVGQTVGWNKYIKVCNLAHKIRWGKL